MPIAFLLPMISQQTYSFCKLGIVGCDHSSLSCGDVLRRVKGETTSSKTAHWFSINCRRVCLTGILNKCQVIGGRQCSQSFHIARMPIQVYRQDCLRKA